MTETPLSKYPVFRLTNISNAMMIEIKFVKISVSKAEKLKLNAIWIGIKKNKIVIEIIIKKSHAYLNQLDGDKTGIFFNVFSIIKNHFKLVM